MKIIRFHRRRRGTELEHLKITQALSSIIKATLKGVITSTLPADGTSVVWIHLAELNLSLYFQILPGQDGTLQLKCWVEMGSIRQH